MAKRHVLLAVLLASIGAIAPAKAEEFPAHPITWVVPFAPGGITDTRGGFPRCGDCYLYGTWVNFK